MPGPDPHSFGVLLRRLRIAAALSQEALAERAGISARGISDLERGVHHAPRLETVRLLADALDLGAQDRGALLAASRPVEMVEPTAPEPGQTRPSTVPRPPTRLIGREQEVTALCQLLARDDRQLVTLTGPGGTGKTHLAQEVAALMASRFPDGVWFVDLSPLTDAELVLPTLSVMLGVPDGRTDLQSRLHSFLGSKHTLLVLDNFERVVSAAPGVALLLTYAPGVRVLATSRIPLHVQGEQEYPLSPLACPSVASTSSLGEVENFPAVRLFVERAQAIQPDFSLSAANAPAIAAICQHVDGLPLAIELAAARVRVLSPVALLSRLETRLALLTGGARTLPARQRTMRDAIAWSYDLLSPEEQALFRRLAIFAGGFTLDAAEAMVEPETGLSAFDGVVALVEHNLLRQTVGSDDEPRFVMLETVREFGREQLALAGDETEARQRHLRHYLPIADELAPANTTWLQNRTRLERMTSELDNVRLAVTWCDTNGEYEQLLQLISVFWVLWQMTGHFHEGLALIEHALEHSRPEASLARLDALAGAVMMSLLYGDYARAAAFSAEERVLAQEYGDLLIIASAKTNAGLLASRYGEFDKAEAFFVDAERTANAIGHVELEHWARLWVGDMALVQGNLEQASKHYAIAWAYFEENDWSWGLADVNAGLGGVHYARGELASSLTHYGASLDRAWQLGVPVLAIGGLLGLAGVVAELGFPDLGGRLFGAAEGLIAIQGTPSFPRDQPARDRALAALTKTLGEERLASLRDEGQAMTFEQAVAAAQAAVDHVRARGSTSPGSDC